MIRKIRRKRRWTRRKQTNKQINVLLATIIKNAYNIKNNNIV